MKEKLVPKISAIVTSSLLFSTKILQARILVENSDKADHDPKHRRDRF